MRYLLFYIITIYQCYYLISKSLMLISKNAHSQGRIQGGRLGRSPPLKLTKVTSSPWFCTIQKNTWLPAETWLPNIT